LSLSSIFRLIVYSFVIIVVVMIEYICCMRLLSR
jgi:hypothetical protein